MRPQPEDRLLRRRPDLLAHSQDQYLELSGPHAGPPLRRRLRPAAAAWRPRPSPAWSGTAGGQGAARASLVRLSRSRSRPSIELTARGQVEQQQATGPRRHGQPCERSRREKPAPSRRRLRRPEPGNPSGGRRSNRARTPLAVHRSPNSNGGTSGTAHERGGRGRGLQGRHQLRLQRAVQVRQVLATGEHLALIADAPRRVGRK